MILDTSQEGVSQEEVAQEFIKKVEILLILMSFIFALLLVLLLISIVMISHLCRRKNKFQNCHDNIYHHDTCHDNIHHYDACHGQHRQSGGDYLHGERSNHPQVVNDTHYSYNENYNHLPQCVHSDYHLHGIQVEYDPDYSPVFTVDSYRGPNYLNNPDPLYEDMREIVTDNSDEAGEGWEQQIGDKNSDDKKKRRNNILDTCLVYGTIVTKEVARYKPSTPIILRK